MFSRNARGLLDFLMAALCLWAAYHHTPAGALVRRGAAWAFDARSTARPLLAYYDGVSSSGVAASCARPRGAPGAAPLRGRGARLWDAPRAQGPAAQGAEARALALAAELGVCLRGAAG